MMADVMEGGKYVYLHPDLHHQWEGVVFIEVKGISVIILWDRNTQTPSLVRREWREICNHLCIRLKKG